MAAGSEKDEDSQLLDYVWDFVLNDSALDTRKKGKMKTPHTLSPPPIVSGVEDDVMMVSQSPSQDDTAETICKTSSKNSEMVATKYDREHEKGAKKRKEKKSDPKTGTCISPKTLTKRTKRLSRRLPSDTATEYSTSISSIVDTVTKMEKCQEASGERNFQSESVSDPAAVLEDLQEMIHLQGGNSSTCPNASPSPRGGGWWKHKRTDYLREPENSLLSSLFPPSNPTQAVKGNTSTDRELRETLGFDYNSPRLERSSSSYSQSFLRRVKEDRGHHHLIGEC